MNFSDSDNFGSLNHAGFSKRYPTMGIGFCCLLVVILCNFFIGCRGEARQDEAAVSKSVSVTPLKSANAVAVERRFLGQVEATRQSDLGFELAGRVSEIMVDEGSVVAADAVLAELDTARLRAAQATLQARLSEAKADEELQRIRNKRLQTLQEVNAVSEQDSDDARLGFAQAQAVTQRIRTELDSIAVELDKSRLIAPFAGTVARRYLDEGAITAMGTPVLRLLEAKEFEVSVGITGKLAKSVHPGDSVRVADSGRSWTMQVDRISTERAAQIRTIQVYLTGGLSATSRTTGDLVDVYLPGPPLGEGYWAPRSALVEGERGLWALYVAAPEDAEGIYRIHRIDARLLRTVGQQVLVDGAFGTDALVVSEGRHRVTPGERVRLSEPTAHLAQNP